MNVVHMGAFIVVLKVPPGQSLQSLSVVEFPAANRNSPSMHEVYGVQLGALLVVLNPVVHAVQIRSLLEVPCTITYSPGSQSVYAAHTLSVVTVPGVAR